MFSRLLRKLPRRQKNKLRGLRHRLRKFLVTSFGSYDAAGLTAGLRRLGIEDGDSVMLHSSFDELCGFRGNITQFTDTLVRALGESGNLLMVSLPYRSSSRTYLERIESFDIRKVPSGMGLVSEFFRRRRTVLRSLHPTHPVLALGRGAEEMVEGHERCLFPCGPGTPFEKLLRADGKVLFFNVPFATFTFFHFLEDMVKDRTHFPLYHAVPFDVPMIDRRGDRTVVTTFVFSDEVIRRRRFPVLETWLRRKGLIRGTKVGNTHLESVVLREVVDAVEEMLGNGVYFYDMTGATGTPVDGGDPVSRPERSEERS